MKERRRKDGSECIEERKKRIKEESGREELEEMERRKCDSRKQEINRKVEETEN